MIEFLIRITFGLSVLASCTFLSETPIPRKDGGDYIKPENIWIFLMTGQSNMAGRGTMESQDLVTNKRIITLDSGGEWIVAKEPLHFYEPSGAGLDCGISFAQELLKNIPDSITIGMVPCAVGGSSVFNWLNDSEHRGVKLLSNFKNKVVLSKAKGTIKGILWHQGESNAKPTDIPVYKDSLVALFDEFRNKIGDEELPILMGELGRFAEPVEKAGYFSEINLILAGIAEEEEHCYLISSEGLGHKGDNLHFNSAAQRELGRRYAITYLEKFLNKKR
ncbi:sialate O-acetylesterase [Flagellimonas sp.]|uniref:sialate O-acetylesterase n=1 Tax=Flagellimonas sp. TaxID=2058762 RepID=UPI003BB0B2CB